MSTKPAFFRPYAIAGGVRLLTIALQLILVGYISRVGGIDTAGQYGQFLAVLTIATIVGLFGQVAAIFSTVPSLVKEDKKVSAEIDAAKYVKTGFIAGVVMGVPLSLAGYVLFSDYLLVLWLYLAIVLNGLIYLGSAISRSFGNVFDSEFHKNSSWRILLFFLLVFVVGNELTIQKIGAMLCVGLTLAVFFNFVKFRSVFTNAFSIKNNVSLNREHKSLHNWGVTTIQALTQQIDIILAGIILEPYQAGIYFILTRIVSFVALPLTVTNPVITPTISRAARGEASCEIRNKITRNTLLNSFLVLTTCAVLLFFQREIFAALSGTGHYEYGLVLLVMLFGQALNGLAGPTVISAQLFNIRQTILQIQVILLVGLVASVLTFGPNYGILGVAFPVAVSRVVLHIAIIFFIKKKHGFSLINGKTN